MGPVGLRAVAGHRYEAIDFGSADGLVLEQGPGHEVEPVAVLGEGDPAPVLLIAQDAFGLLVDDPGRLVAVVAGLHQILAQEHLVL